MGPVNPQELAAYIDGFYAAMDIIKQQENQTITAANDLINQMK